MKKKPGWIGSSFVGIIISHEISIPLRQHASNLCPRSVAQSSWRFTIRICRVMLVGSLHIWNDKSTRRGMSWWMVPWTFQAMFVVMWCDVGQVGEKGGKRDEKSKSQNWRSWQKEVLLGKYKGELAWKAAGLKIIFDSMRFSSLHLGTWHAWLVIDGTLWVTVDASELESATWNVANRQMMMFNY